LVVAFVAFIGGALVSLATSWVLVTRLERVGERFGLSEALLGVTAALGADAPEITSSVTALAHHQRVIGAGVVIGSNAFNLAALLGLGAVIAVFVALHRRVIVLGGVVAMWIAVWCVLAATGNVGPLLGLILSASVLVIYLVTLGLRREALNQLPLPRGLRSWIVSAIAEEEVELQEAIRPPRGRPSDVVTACGALVVVVVASVAMEHGASSLGRHFHIADAVVGGVILAGVTSLPNAVAAVHLAAKGRGAAALSTALMSNNLNVVAGLLIPGAIVGLSRPTFAGNLTALTYLVLTGVVLALAFAQRGLSRRSGWLIMSSYAIFVIWLISVT
jgi:cation:H+ antiporter